MLNKKKSTNIKSLFERKDKLIKSKDKFQELREEESKIDIKYLQAEREIEEQNLLKRYFKKGY